MKTKEDFKHSKKWLENRLKNNKPLCKWNRGYLEALEDYENLILFGVGSSVKVKIDEPFEIEETNEKYVCELNNFIDKDGCWCIETVIAKLD